MPHQQNQKETKKTPNPKSKKYKDAWKAVCYVRCLSIHKRQVSQKQNKKNHEAKEKL